LFCIDGRCAPVPTVLHALPDSRLAVNNSRVTYSCETGYRFPDDDASRDWVTCNGADWLGQVPDCVRMLSYYNIRRTSKYVDTVAVMLRLCVLNGLCRLQRKRSLCVKFSASISIVRTIIIIIIIMYYCY